MSVYIYNVVNWIYDEYFLLIAIVVLTAFSFILVRIWAAGGVCQCHVRLTGKTVLVTGANTGIGLETARDLARRGARVLLACRNKDKAVTAARDISKSTGSTDVEIYILDLASLQSVRRCADEIRQKEPRLDILINNAAVYGPQRFSTDGYELTFATNHLGHFLLTNLLLDLIKSSTPSRIINVSSLVHSKGQIDFDDIQMSKNYNYFKAYCNSKLANVLFTRTLSRRLTGTNVTANCLHPGLSATGIDGDFPFQHSLKVLFGVLLFKTVVESAQTTIYCAVADELSDVSGKYFVDCVEKIPSSKALDEVTAEQLWTVSAEMVGL